MSSVVTISHAASGGNVQQDSIWTKSKDPSVILESEDLEVTLEFDSLQDGNETRGHDSANHSEKDEGCTHQDSFGSTSATAIELLGSQTEAGTPSSTKKVSAAQAIVRRHPKNGPDALIVLKEEKVCSLTFPNVLQVI